VQIYKLVKHVRRFVILGNFDVDKVREI